mmetsp:Transcript_105708/g.305660  ORF Transcript_105708/g.305660 Transcript_105708/m.305660 type:complete len:249 (+) Transcript_105708:330-1076(+)
MPLRRARRLASFEDAPRTLVRANGQHLPPGAEVWWSRPVRQVGAADARLDTRATLVLREGRWVLVKSAMESSKGQWDGTPAADPPESDVADPALDIRPANGEASRPHHHRRSSSAMPTSRAAPHLRHLHSTVQAPLRLRQLPEPLALALVLVLVLALALVLAPRDCRPPQLPERQPQHRPFTSPTSSARLAPPASATARSPNEACRATAVRCEGHGSGSGAQIHPAWPRTCTRTWPSCRTHAPAGTRE